MNVAKGLKLHDLILSFLLLSRTIVGSKTFLFIMEGIGTLRLFEFELYQSFPDVKAIISHSVLIFLLSAG